MTYTLTLCLGMFLGICGSAREFDFPDAASCESARSKVSQKAVGDGYAVCAPKAKKEPK